MDDSIFLLNGLPRTLYQKKHILFVAIWLLAPLIGQSQLVHRLNNLKFHHLDQNDGLSELQNAYISEDSRGYMWFGSYDGINRFDGKNIKVFQPLLANGGKDSHVSSKVFEDDLGRLWFTTYKGLYCIDPMLDTIQNIPIPIAFQKDLEDCYAFYLEYSRVLWMVANDTLRKMDLISGKCESSHFLKTYVCEPIIGLNGQVTGLAIPKPDEPSGINILVYDKKGGHTINSFFNPNNKEGQPVALIIGAKAEGDSLLWLSTDLGLIRFPIRNPNRFRVITIDQNSLYFDEVPWQNFRWITLNPGGLCLVDSNGVPIWTTNRIQVEQYSVAFNHLNNIMVSKDGTLWISSWGKGIYFTNLNANKFDGITSFHPISLTEKTAISSVCPGNKGGSVWCAAKDGRLLAISEDNIIGYDQIALPFGLPVNNKSKRVFQDSGKCTWIQIGGELWMDNGGTHRFELKGVNLDGVSKVVRLKSGNRYVLTTTKLFRMPFSEKKVVDYSKIQALTTWKRVYEMFSVNEQYLMVSDGFDKLFVYKEEEKELLLVKELSGVGFVNGLVEVAGKGQVWLATNRGLLVLHIPQFELEMVSALPKIILPQSFNGILPDLKGRLWLSSNSGLYRYDPGNGELKHYTESDGLQALQFIPGSATTLPDGRLAFGGVNGLNVFHPDSIHDNPNPPRIHFTNWVVNDTGSISTAPEYLPFHTFTADQNTLSFSFVGIDFVAPDEVLYRYQLKGYDQDTVEGGNNGFARYAKLPAGHYTFQVWAANSDGVWSAEPHELSFAVLPPWYKTWWAITLYILSIGFLGFRFYRNRVARIKKEEADRRKEAEFRQKEAEAKQQAAEWQNAVLRLQMNPHFLFNSMNSISSYLLQKDVDTAQDYLARFSHLMRRILELAAKPFIPIQDETELLEQYMAVESMRFENAFRWTIQVAPDIDPDEVQVPTMILQPFVENAIWHGFSGKTGQGHIQISFSWRNGMLCCTVEDNGAGRKIPQPDQEPRKVTAIQITRQRLAGFKPVSGQQPYLHFQDLLHPDGSAAGTKVEIWLPPDL